MELLWPGFLALLALLPLIVAFYIWVLRRRRRFALRYSSLSLVRAAAPSQSRLRRHLPFALFVLALASLVLALGRPVAIVEVPSSQATILLAIDVSRSMCSTDIPPSRIAAAKAAALEFIQSQEPGTRIGVVAFARFAELIQQPTTEQDDLEAAIEGLLTGRGTAIGSGILRSLDAIAEIDPNVAPSNDGTFPEPTPLPADVFNPEIIVLLTDGVSTDGASPYEAAQQAAVRGVRVYTIGFGTAEGSGFDPACGPGFGGGGRGGSGGDRGGFGGGGGFRRGIDETALRQIAAMTGGEYYGATSAGELQGVFEELPTYFTTRRETSELSVAFSALGAVLVVLAVGLALLWNPLP